MNRFLKLLFLCNGIFVFASSLLGPLYALYIDKLGNSIMSISFLWSIYLGTTTIGTAVLTKYRDNVLDKEKLLYLGFAIFLGGIITNYLGFKTLFIMMAVIALIPFAIMYTETTLRGFSKQ